MQTPWGLMLMSATTAAGVLYAEQEGKLPIPCKYYDEALPALYEYPENVQNDPYYRAISEIDEVLGELLILNQFSLRLLQSSTEADSEIAKVVNEHFWDLM